jgi:S1-C subfamily serine protease
MSLPLTSHFWLSAGREPPGHYADGHRRHRECAETKRLRRQGAPTIQNAIQTDAPINPGNSGGALVDLQGNVVGIPTLTALDPEFNTPANGVGFAIPINRVKTILPQFIQG